jgi:TAF6 C-terminal HEAT repeat domain
MQNRVQRACGLTYKVQSQHTACNVGITGVIMPPDQDAASADHWAVRDAAARIVSTVCTNFGDPLHNIRPRISKTLLKALLDCKKPVTTHYGVLSNFVLALYGALRLHDGVLGQQRAWQCM